MKALVAVLVVAVLGLCGLVLQQGAELSSLEERLEVVERGALVVAASSRPGSAQGGEQARPQARQDQRMAALAAARQRRSGPATEGAPASVQEVLAQPGARSQIAEIVREEQEEAEQQRWESRRQLRIDMLRDEAEAWVDEEGLEPEVGEELTALLEGWVEQRFDLRDAVMSGGMSHSEAREEGTAMRDELRAAAEELVGEEAMPALTERFPMLALDGGRRPGPPRF